MRGWNWSVMGLAVVLCSNAADGQCGRGALTADDAAANDQLGFSVAMSGDLCVVGARLDDNAAINAGCAYVYRFDVVSGVWTQEAKLIASDAAANDEFGYSVAACQGGKIAGGPADDVVVVGARYDDDAGSESGSAYIFQRVGGVWTQVVKLTASDAAATDHFGYAVSICGPFALVANRDDDNPGTNTGSAYIFKYNGAGWTQQAKIKASDAAANDQFGQSVALAVSDDGAKAMAVVGSWHDDSPLSDAGSAYVFRYNPVPQTWTQEAKLVAPDAAASDVFGYAVAAAVESTSGGDVVLVGARDDDDQGSNAGSAYVFRKNGPSWVQETKLKATDRTSNDGFGYSVALDRQGEEILVGAWKKDIAAPDSGAAYLFLRQDSGSWLEWAQLVADDGGQDDWFGAAVAISGDRAIVGAYQHDAGAPDTGLGYLFGGVAGIDLNYDGQSDSCELAGDVNDDGRVDGTDLVAVIGAWGACPPPPGACPADLTGDGIVDMDDLFTVINHWLP